jgi:hypothetical protein
MCAQQHHPWGLSEGLDCTGVGELHAVVFVASDAPDAHTSSEQNAEAQR